MLTQRTQLVEAPPRMPAFLRGLITFHIVTFAWMFFRAARSVRR